MTPKLTWAAAFANTWLWQTAADNPRPLTIIRGTEATAKSGAFDFWEERTDEELLLTAVLIPKLAVGSVTGYATASTGVREALAWLARGNVGRFYSDSTSGSYHTVRLIDFDPMRDIRRSRGGARYDIDLHFRDTAGVPFTEY